MKKKAYFLIIYFAVAALFFQCRQQDNITQDENAFPVLTGPYPGQKVPGLEPEMFAPGIVSTGLMDGVCNFSYDGTELHFASNMPTNDPELKNGLNLFLCHSR